jgi:methionyl-tRNA synthetase
MPLFPKLDDEAIERIKGITTRVTEYEEMFKEVDYEEFAKLDLRTAKVVEVERVGGSDKLLKLKVDVGGKEKQLVAGIGQHYKPEELTGKTVVIIDNLKPAVIKGEKSEGMLLAAVAKDKISLVTVDKEVESGSKVE